MANITITVQSLLNAANYDSYTIDNGQTIDQLKTAIQTATEVSTTWFDIVLNETIASGSATLASLGIISGSKLRTHNKISRLPTLELRQKSKLDLAALDRAALDNDRSTYDITELPTQYDDDSIIDNPNIGGLVDGRPWIPTTEFTFYEAINSTSALYTTQHVSGNKIYAYSSSFDVPGFQPARVVVNDIEVLVAGTGTRGHNMVVLDTYGDVVSIANYDTYNVPSSLTALASALNAVASGNIVVLVVYDASAFDAGCRAALTNGYGDTNTNVWTPIRYDHIFIGVKI
jgi:hypothetical protein